MPGKIAALVFAAHVSLLLGMLVDHGMSPRPVRRRPIAVRTQQAPPPLKTASAAARSSPTSPPPAKANVKPHAAPKAQGKRPGPQQPKQAAPLRPERRAPLSTLKNIEESFAALALPEPVATSPLDLPKALEYEAQGKNDSYGACLIEMLQEQLQLPELGEVKARIVLSAPGKVSSVEIVDAKSHKNAEWLKNRLHLLEAPCFNDFGIKDTAMEFTITFRNAEHL